MKLYMLFIEAIKVLIFAFANISFLLLNYNMMNKLRKYAESKKDANPMIRSILLLPLP